MPKISELTALTGAGTVAATDQLAIADISASTTKSITPAQLRIGMGVGATDSPTFVGLTLSGALAGATTIASTTSVLTSGATGGIGYATGAGGTVTQATSRTTGVTLNKVTGNIVLVSAAGSATPFSFTLTNSAIAAGDTVIINQKSGTDIYTTQVVTAVAAGSCRITLANASGTTTEQPVFNFNVVKGVAA